MVDMALLAPGMIGFPVLNSRLQAPVQETEVCSVDEQMNTSVSIKYHFHPSQAMESHVQLC